MLCAGVHQVVKKKKGGREERLRKKEMKKKWVNEWKIKDCEDTKRRDTKNTRGNGWKGLDNRFLQQFSFCPSRWLQLVAGTMSINILTGNFFQFWLMESKMPCGGLQIITGLVVSVTDGCSVQIVDARLCNLIACGIRTSHCYRILP